MSLITDAGGRESDSYVTLEETLTYLETLYSEDQVTLWEDREEAQKEQMLRIGVLFIDELSYRGALACRDQSLKFPRWWDTDLYRPTYDDQYIEMIDIPNYATPIVPDRNNLYGCPPVIPENVKKAQIELTFRIVHGYLLKSDAELMAYPEHDVRSFSLGGGMTIDFFSRSSADPAAWAMAKVTSMNIVQAYLQRWIRHFVGTAV